jgi:hypothetical protein
MVEVPHAAKTSLMLTARDLEILAMICRYDGLVVELIRRRFWPSSGARSACYDRVARLITDGYLRATRLPSLTGRGSGKAFLTLGLRGRKELAAYLDDPALLRQPSAAPGKPQFVAHHLAIADARLSIELAIERHSDVALLDWTTERELRSQPIRVRDPLTLTDVPIVPDGAFVLAVQSHEPQRFFLEQDMGTVSPKRLRAKLRAYLTYLASVLVPVLFVVPNVLRLQAIVQWTEAEASNLAADPTLVWVVTSSAVSETSVLSEPIWHVVGVSERQSLVPTDHEAQQRGAPRFRGQLLFGGGAAS